MAKADGTVTPGERFDGIDRRLLNLEQGQQSIIRKVDLLWWKVGSVSAVSGAVIGACVTNAIWWLRTKGG